MGAPYENLLTYKFSVAIHDLTVEFCRRFILGYMSSLGTKPDTRTADQMDQAARSCKQNIVEGASSMRTSLKTAIVLTGVARSSIEELLTDYKDFLRQRKLTIWQKDSPKAMEVREKIGKVISFVSDLSNLSSLSLPESPEDAGNLLLTLCHQESYLLHKQIDKMEQKLINEGGYSENLLKRRREKRGY
jgi:four helix bundle suffix protein